MLLKFCGLTREKDARFATTCGADFVGAIIVPASKRYVTAEQARRLFEAASPAKGVLVVRDMPLDELQKTIDFVHPHAGQLHGSETADYALSLHGTHIWKAFNVNRLESVQMALDFPAELIVADSGGGTGTTCDWSRAAELAKCRPVFLAGGITSDNVREAIEAVRPAGIDLAGGVESAPGIKDHAKMARLASLVH